MKKSTPRQAWGEVIVIVGPTASGKSELGAKLAKKINGEIISADSRQVYKKLDVGSGKVRGKWKKGIFIYKKIPHYCIDIANPKKVFTAMDFKNCAQKAIVDILARGKTPIIVGGTGFYIDAALGKIQLGGVPLNQNLRWKLSKKSVPELLKMLKKLDSVRAQTIEQKNPRRLIRAIEIALKPLSPTPPSPFVRGKGVKGRTKMSEESALVAPSISWLGIKRSPEELKKRILARLLRRLPRIVREVKKLKRDGLSWKRLYELGLEYRYVSLYLRGKFSKLQLTNQLTSAICKYARRQMTWFKKNEEIRWISSQKEALRHLKFKTARLRP